MMRAVSIKVRLYVYNGFRLAGIFFLGGAEIFEALDFWVEFKTAYVLYKLLYKGKIVIDYFDLWFIY